MFKYDISVPCAPMCLVWSTVTVSHLGSWFLVADLLKRAGIPIPAISVAWHSDTGSRFKSERSVNASCQFYSALFYKPSLQLDEVIRAQIDSSLGFVLATSIQT